MAYQLAEINRRAAADPAEFLAQCDREFQSKVSAAADKIVSRLSMSPIVLLSGPSGSGKTTTALKIEEELEKRGVNTHTISLDNYFKTLDRPEDRGGAGEAGGQHPHHLPGQLLQDPGPPHRTPHPRGGHRL